MGNIKIKIKIYGIVQGVFFRMSAVDKAHELGIVCDPQNMPDNTVEINVQGEKNSIDKFIEWCKKGPDMAKVEKIKIDRY